MIKISVEASDIKLAKNKIKKKFSISWDAVITYALIFFGTCVRKK